MMCKPKISKNKHTLTAETNYDRRDARVKNSLEARVFSSESHEEAALCK